MARSKRQWVSQDVGSYHIVSRVAGGELLFNSEDKEYFFKLLKCLAASFFVEIHAFAVMSNHFHILATGLEREAGNASKEELFRRYRLIYGKNAEPPTGTIDSCGQLILDDDDGVERLRRRLGSISRFVQELKQNYSRWYNKKYKRTGYLWGGRFKGQITSKGEGQLAISTYIDLNPVRAHIVKKPEDYRWNSLGLRVRESGFSTKILRPLAVLPSSSDFSENCKNPGTSVETLLQPIVLSENSYDHYFTYREFVYKTGSIIQKKGSHLLPDVLDEVMAYHRSFGVAGRFRYRVKNFSEGLALGNYALIANLQKNLNRKKIQPRSFMGKDSNCSWAYTTRVLRQ